MKGWNLSPEQEKQLIMSLDRNDPLALQRYLQTQEQEIQREYADLVGNPTYASAQASRMIGMVLPASGKFLDPEKPDIDPIDIMFDVAMVIPAIGYISKAGHLIKNASLAAKLITLAEVTSNATFTVAQGMMLAKDWEHMTNETRAMLIGMTGLTTVFAGLGMRKLLTPEVRAKLKTQAIAMGKDLKVTGKLALTDEAGFIGKRPEKTPTEAAFKKYENAPVSGTPSPEELQFIDDIKKMTPEEGTQLAETLKRDRSSLANREMYGATEAADLKTILASDPLYSKQLNLGMIQEKGRRVKEAIWRTASGEKNVTITKELPAKGGIKYYKVVGEKNPVPETELFDIADNLKYTSAQGTTKFTSLGDFVYWRFGKAGELPEAFSKGDASIMTGYDKNHVWPDHMLNKNGKVKAEYIMDGVGKETGFTDYNDVVEHLNDYIKQRNKLSGMNVAGDFTDEINGYTRQLEILKGMKPVESQMAASTSVQTGLEGMGKESAQVKMFEESNVAAGQGGVKESLITPEGAANKPLAGQETLSGMGEPPKPPGEPPKPPKEPPTALATTPEPPPEPKPDIPEIAKTMNDAGNPNLTKAQTEYLLDAMAKFANSQDVLTQRAAAEILRKSVLSIKFKDYAALTDKLLAEGKPFEEAMKQAMEAMRGAMPDVLTDFFSDLTRQMRDVLFAKIYHTYPATMVGKRLTAVTTLTKWLQGKSLKLTEGAPYSELIVMREVFGEQPVILRMLEDGARNKKPLREILEGKFHEIGLDPIPVDAEAAEYLRKFNAGGRQAGLETGGIPWGGEPAPVFTEIPKPTFGTVRIFKVGEETIAKGVTKTDIPEEILTAGKKIMDNWNPEIPAPADIRTELQKVIAYLELKPNKTADDLINLNLFKHWEAGEVIGKMPSGKGVTWIAIPLKENPIVRPLIPDLLRDYPVTFKFFGNRAFTVHFNLMQTLKEIGMLPVDIGNFLRANLASFDQSFGRQVAPLIPAHPIKYITAFVNAWKATFSQRSAEAAWLAITSHPAYGLYVELGLDFLRPFKLAKGTAAWKGVEEYGFLNLQRLIPRLTAKIPWIKFSERGFVTGINDMTWNVFLDRYESILRTSEKIAAGEAKAPKNGFSIIKELKPFGRLLEDFSGRAQIGYLGKFAPVASSLFFSMRLNFGRFFMPRHLVSLNGAVRKEAWKDLSLFVGSITGLEILGEQLGYWEVEKDPRSADFMTMRMGNIRVDPWGGMKQFAVLYSRIVTGKGKSSVTGKEYDAKFLDTLLDFFWSKVSPLAGFIIDVKTGTTYTGEKIDLTNAGQWLNRTIPLAVQDALDAYNEQGWEGVPKAIPSFLGANVQTYKGDFDSYESLLGTEKYPELLPYGIPSPIYDVQDYFADTAKEVRGVDIGFYTATKGYSDKVRAVSETTKIQDNLNLLPSEKLTSLNHDPKKNGGKTYRVYYEMWQDRLKIEATGDKEKLAAFDKDEITSQAYMGNFSKRQLMLLDEYYAKPLNERAKFLKEYPEIKENPRQKYLTDNPTENAKLAVFGQADVYTQAAYNQAVKLAVELDIPDSALRKYLPPAELAAPLFEYNNSVLEFGSASNETLLIRAKNPKLNEWKELEDILTPIPTLETNVKNHALNNQFDGYSDKETQWYLPSIPDKKDPNYQKGREYAREKFRKDNPVWVDDQRRIEVFNNKGTPVNEKEWIEHGKLVDSTSPMSPEAKLYLINHPATFKWAVDNFLLTDNGKDWNIPVLKIDVEYKKNDTEYDKIKNDNASIQAKQREEYLKGNPVYQVARIQRDGYNLGITTPALLNQWTEYNKLPDYGMYRKRYLKDHPELFGEVTKLQKANNQQIWETPDPKKIPLQAYDDIYEQFKERFEAYDNVQGTADERDKQRKEIYKLNPEFKSASLARQAYGEMFPESMVQNFVEYYNLPATGYIQERYLKENPEFYKEIFTRREWKEAIKFNEIPTAEVEALYNIYQHLPVTGKQREMYRTEHPDLDKWLVDIKKMQPLNHSHERTTMTEKIEEYEGAARAVKTIKDLIEALVNRK